VAGLRRHASTEPIAQYRGTFGSEDLDDIGVAQHFGLEPARLIRAGRRVILAGNLPLGRFPLGCHGVVSHNCEKACFEGDWRCTGQVGGGIPRLLVPAGGRC